MLTRMLRSLALFLCVGAAQVFAQVPMNTTSSAAAQISSLLAPTGQLRAVINLGNAVLAGLDAQQQPVGVSVDMARELARRLNLPLQLTVVKTAAESVAALAQQQVDIGFVAIDPVRGRELAYTAPYVTIEGAYLVRNNSHLHNNAEVDQAGHSVVVGKGSAYDLFLTREIKHATLVRAASSQVVVDDFLSQGHEVAAGVRQQLEKDAARLGGVRMLPGRFMAIEQAMAVPKTRDAAVVTYVHQVVEELKASGFVAQALARHRIEGVAVAAPQAQPPKP